VARRLSSGRQLRLRRRSRGRTRAAAYAQQVTRHVGGRFTVNPAAADTGRCKRTVEFLKRRVRQQRRGCPFLFTSARKARLRSEGMTQQAIADALGVDKATVCRDIELLQTQQLDDVPQQPDARHRARRLARSSARGSGSLRSVTGRPAFLRPSGVNASARIAFSSIGEA